MVDARVLGHCEHQSHTPALEERHVAGVEEELQAELVAVEVDGDRKIVRADRNLADVLDRSRHVSPRACAWLSYVSVQHGERFTAAELDTLGQAAARRAATRTTDIRLGRVCCS